MKHAGIIAVLYFLTSYVNSHSHCVGTCYSGQLFPEPKDIFHGKHLKGYSYNNITTHDPARCYRHCVQDCRCKACQMKDARCELLDEDKTSKADDFKDESRYVYFDLRQTMYQGESHMLPPHISCYNGCCRSQPCMNGGTCVEHCDTPKQKFTCKCSSGNSGKVCEKKPSYCMDIMLNSPTVPADGVYTIKRSDNSKLLSVYCSFISPNQSWTLIESFSLKNRAEFERKPFSLDFSANKDDPPSWDRFRMGIDRMNYFKSKSALFRATCDFPKRSSLTPDLLIGSLSDVDIMSNIFACKRYKFIDIRGYNCTSCTAATYHGAVINGAHFHLDVTWSSLTPPCSFKPPSKNDVDSFGCYFTVDDISSASKYGVSKCTATPNSTTQWWFGQEAPNLV